MAALSEFGGGILLAARARPRGGRVPRRLHDVHRRVPRAGTTRSPRRRWRLTLPRDLRLLPAHRHGRFSLDALFAKRGRAGRRRGGGVVGGGWSGGVRRLVTPGIAATCSFCLPRPSPLPRFLRRWQPDCAALEKRPGQPRVRIRSCTDILHHRAGKCAKTVLGGAGHNIVCVRPAKTSFSSNTTSGASGTATDLSRNQRVDRNFGFGVPPADSPFRFPCTRSQS